MNQSFLTTLTITATFAFAGCATTSSDVTTQDHATTKTQASAASQDAGAQMKLPPGWTEADMQACMAAGTPGEMQKKLARGAGHWTGKSKMWMAPGTEPMTSEVSSNVSTIMDGRFSKCEFEGDMMGPFQGLGYCGYDNVGQKFMAVWFDNHSTGIMNGEGTMSSDGTLTWNYHLMCPITKKPTVMRQVERHSGENSMTLDMYGDDPKSGKEFQMMHIEMTRTSP